MDPSLYICIFLPFVSYVLLLYFRLKPHQSMAMICSIFYLSRPPYRFTSFRSVRRHLVPSVGAGVGWFCGLVGGRGLAEIIGRSLARFLLGGVGLGLGVGGPLRLTARWRRGPSQTTRDMR